jgi:hypothetical protein
MIKARRASVVGEEEVGELSTEVGRAILPTSAFVKCILKEVIISANNRSQEINTKI